MANRYFVGNSGNWSDTAHWSATSGGAGGQTVPTGSDNTFIDTNSGSGIVTADIDIVIGGRFYQESMTFNANGHDITANDFYFFADTGLTPTVTMGLGTWTATGNGDVWVLDENTGQIVTINVSTSTIKFTDTSVNSVNFAIYNNVNAKTYNNLWLSGGTRTGDYTFQGSNTFNDFKDDGTEAHRILFDDGTTTTVSTFTVSGSSGKLITLVNGQGVSAFTVTKAGGGTISSDYLSISYSTATPANTWYAGTHSTDVGNNSGWIFTAIPSFTNQTKNLSTFSNQSKNTSNNTNQAKNTSTFSGQTKKTSSFTNQSKNTSVFTNQTKN